MEGKLVNQDLANSSDFHLSVLSFESREFGHGFLQRNLVVGQGIGKAPSLRQPLVTQAPAGSLFWVIRNGEILHGMPSFAHLPEPERWQLVSYIKALNEEKAAGGK